MIFTIVEVHLLGLLIRLHNPPESFKPSPSKTQTFILSHFTSLFDRTINFLLSNTHSLPSFDESIRCLDSKSPCGFDLDSPPDLFALTLLCYGSSLIHVGFDTLVRRLFGRVAKWRRCRGLLIVFTSKLFLRILVPHSFI